MRRPKIKDAYIDYCVENELFGYKNKLKDKIEFFTMWLRGDYNYLLEEEKPFDLNSIGL